MAFMMVWGVILAFAALIVLGRQRMLRQETEAVGLALTVREAARLRMLSCSIPLTAEETLSRLSDGRPAGGLVCAWDEERGAYCFCSELPDGSIPLYCTASLSCAEQGVRLTLVRQRGLLHGNKDVALRLSVYLSQRMGATDFACTLDEGMR